MFSDEDCREVAARLRGARYGWHNWERALYDALGVDTETAGLDMLDRLADLIEPSIPSDPGEAGLASVDGFIREMRHSTKEERDEYNAMLEKMSVELHPVDRAALLKLADEIDRKSNDGTTNPDPMRPLATSLDLFGYASRIRKALGADDA